jgi:beta-propeller repeat-containing protein
MAPQSCGPVQPGRLALLLVLCLAMLGSSATAQAKPAPGEAESSEPTDTQSRLAAAFGKLPLSFEVNQGQVDPAVDFVAHSRGATVLLSAGDAVLAPRAADSSQPSAGTEPAALRLQLLGADPQSQVEALDALPGTASYFVGDDPAGWHTGVPTYARVQYRAVYPGIDVRYYGGADSHLEYDFIVAPGANPSAIQLGFQGAAAIELAETGDLVMHVGGGEVRMQPPTAYQELDGVRQAVASRYVLTDSERVGVELGTFDPERQLTIDPVLVYSTYLGGSGTLDTGVDIAVDAAGSAYVTGGTNSLDFPTTAGAFQRAAPVLTGGNANVFVSKLNPTGTALVYSTYLGGGSEDDPGGIAVDPSGHAYVSGLTGSTNFPTTPGAFQRTLTDRSIFVTKLNSTGTALVYSTLVGPSEFGTGLSRIAVDGTGQAYVTATTTSAEFPTTPGAFQPTFGGGLCGPDFDLLPCADAFVTKLNATGTGLVYSSFLGGSGEDVGRGIAVDASGIAYLVGRTRSTNFPTSPGAFLRQRRGNTDVFVSKVNSAGTALIYSTLLGGGDDDNGKDIATDGSGNAYVTGETLSTDFPTTPGALQHPPSASGQPLFVTKVNATGTALVYSTYLRGDAATVFTEVNSIAVDATGNAYLTGWPTFVAKLNRMGTALVYFKRLVSKPSSVDVGIGIALDAAGNVYVTGATRSTEFPTTQGAFQRTLRGVTNGFVAKLALGPPDCTVLGVLSGPPAQLRIAVHADRGLASIVVTQVSNATIALPTFAKGSTDTQLVTATKLDQSRPATVTLRATDQTGSSTSCDPALVTVGHAPDDSPVQVIRHLDQAEGHLTISNGTPGVDRVRLLVNGQPFKVADLHDGETRTLDVTPAMRRGDNTILVVAHGARGASAVVMVADS